MVKTDFIGKIAEKTNMTKKDTDIIVTAIAEVITEALVDGDDVTIPGVCKFCTVDVPERSGTSLGVNWTKPAHRAPKIKAVKALKDAVADEI